jgi:hypothetical protein
MMLRSGGGESRPRTSPRSGRSAPPSITQKQFAKNNDSGTVQQLGQDSQRRALGSASRARENRTKQAEAVDMPKSMAPSIGLGSPRC